MAGRIRRALTFANVCSFLALTIALGTGGAYAANTVFSTDIVDGEVKNADIGGNQVTTTKIKAGNVMNTDIGPDAVDGSKILDAAIANADLASGAVNGASVLDESLTSSDLATDSVNATEIADNSIDGGEIVNESLGAGELAAGSVTASELASNAVTSGDVANNSISTADLVGIDLNPGHVGFSAGAVPNGRCEQIDLAVGGAVAGQSVIINTLGAMQEGVVFYGKRVPSAGHVTADLCNFSGTTMDAIDNLAIRIITFG